MSSLQAVQAQRETLVSAIAKGSVDKYECLLDHLLSEHALSWEEYESCIIVGQPLSSLIRGLLDTITCKGEESCSIFLEVLNNIQSSRSKENCRLPPPKDPSEALSYLQRERPRIVQFTHDYLNTIFQLLLGNDCFSSLEIENIQLPIYSASQKARRLLNLIHLKGQEPARCLIEFIQKQEKGETAHVTDVCRAFHKKLRNTISAQTQFLTTYDGTENMRLEDVYTESVLELPKVMNMSKCTQGSQLSLNLLNFFKDQGILNEKADTILILGDAGSGKSTLLQQIQNLWASGKAFQNFSFIFPFSCRRLYCMEKPASLKTLIFEQCCWPDTSQEDIFQFILEHPSQVLITFDGFDEFKFPFTDENKQCSPTETSSIASIVFNLIQGNLMKDCLKVVTSRPDVINVALRKYIKKEINLRGFSEKSIEAFILKHHKTPDTSKDLMSLVKTSSSLNGLCHIPVFCWIISKCHKELINCGDKTLQTITSIYLLTLKHFLRHGLSNAKQTPNILSENINTIKHLGKLAFSGLCQGLYVFSYQDIAQGGVTEEDLSLGFLVLSKNFSGTEDASLQYYEFLHITFQCFFAALYIVTSDDVISSTLCQLFKWNKDKITKPRAHNQHKFLLQDMKINNLQIVATFVAGLFSAVSSILFVDSRQPEKLSKKRKVVIRCLSKAIRKHFKAIPPALPNEKKALHAMPEFVWLIKCIYEMQDVALAERAIQGLAVDHLKMTYCGIGPAECTALAYVLKHLKKPTGIQLDHNSVGNTGIKQLIPCLHVCHSLYLRDNNISDEGIRILMEHALEWPNFQKIALFSNKLKDGCMESIANLLKKKQNFLALRLGNNYITEVGGQILAEGLKENHSLKYLGLWGNQVGDIGAKAIADVLQNNRSIIWLSLVGNNIGSIGGHALANMLKKNTVLTELWLDENKLQDNHAIELAKSLRENYSLKILKISSNHFSKAGVSAFAETLKHNNTLKEIWLEGTNLTDEDMETYGKMDRLFLKAVAI
ncbi:nucleotide-binding oligomerization domain-containing protein 2 [Gastrophryne carolinensis]